MGSKKIIAILLSIGLVIAGLSGEVVIGGTNISTILVIVGLIWLAIEIIWVKKTRQRTKQPIVAGF